MRNNFERVLLGTVDDIRKALDKKLPLLGISQEGVKGEHPEAPMSPGMHSR